MWIGQTSQERIMPVTWQSEQTTKRPWVSLHGRRSCVCVLFESVVVWLSNSMTWILTDWAFSSSVEVSVTVMWVGTSALTPELATRNDRAERPNWFDIHVWKLLLWIYCLGHTGVPPPSLSLQQHPSLHTKNISNDNTDLGYYWKKNSCIHVRARMTPVVIHTHTHTHSEREMKKLDTCFSWGISLVKRGQFLILTINQTKHGLFENWTYTFISSQSLRVRHYKIKSQMQERKERPNHSYVVSEHIVHKIADKYMASTDGLFFQTKHSLWSRCVVSVWNNQSTIK